MKFFIAIITAAVLTLAGLSVAAEKQQPFYPGEKLVFDLKWTIIKAGEATLEVLPVETVNGVKAYHFVMTAKSLPFLDVFYKIRDQIDAYIDTEITHSILYKKKQHEGSTRRDEELIFDWEKKEVQYSNFGEKKDPLPLSPGAFDPLSAFYYTRFFDLEEGMVIERPVTDGKKCVIGKASVKKREQIKVSGKTYDAFLIEPELKHIGGVFEKSKDAKIKLWVSADHRRIPLRIESKVIVGSFVAELISAEGIKRKDNKKADTN